MTAQEKLLLWSLVGSRSECAVTPKTPEAARILAEMVRQRDLADQKRSQR